VPAQNACLKFNRPFENAGPTGGAEGDWVMPHEGPLLLRFLAKLLFDILPASLASIIGGILFTHYQMGYAGAPRPPTEQAAPASAEMIRLLRDEHAAIVDFLKAQTAAEKSRLAAEDEASARSVAEARAAVAATVAAAAVPASVVAASRRPEPTVAAAKPAVSRGRAPVAATPHAPLVIAQAEQSGGSRSAAPPVGNSGSLLARTLDFKDRVVDATLHVIGTLGSIPSLIASGGERVGASNANAPVGRLVGASS
jgi:hypothetical protein